MRTITLLWVVRESLSEEESFKLRPETEKNPGLHGLEKSILGGWMTTRKSSSKVINTGW